MTKIQYQLQYNAWDVVFSQTKSPACTPYSLRKSTYVTEMLSRLPYRHTNIIVTVGYVLMFRCQYKNTMPSNEQIQSKGNLKNVLFESLTLNILTLNILSKQKKACHIFRAELLACVSQLTDPLGYNNNKSK